VLFDTDLAYDLCAEIDDEMECINHKVIQLVPPTASQHGVVVEAPFKKNGQLKKLVWDWYGDKAPNVGGAFTRIRWIPMNLNSSPQVKDYLLSEGWIPTQWNMKDGEKMSPKLTEDSFDSIQSEIPKMIARYNILKHRRNSILNIKNPHEKGWIALLRDDGRLEAKSMPQATNTGRYRHSIVVNVPKASDKVVYGKEMRSLFRVPEGKLMLGCDASALEARMEAHYCYNYTGGKAYAYELIDGDIHAKNAVLFGTDRDGAKAPKYAMTYGAQPPKIAETLGIPIWEAKRLYDAFWDGNTALAEFRDHVTRVWDERGYLYGLDGRKIFIRSKHAIVNAMFQSGGSIVVKVATLFLNKWIRERKLDAHQILHMHDEFQFEIRPEDEEEITELALEAFVKSGEFLKVSVPIIGDVKVGRNWCETH
jgi:DNA polymerase-1